jgi:iron-sulfur cluster repair protein YtfE (RIC family)
MQVSVPAEAPPPADEARATIFSQHEVIRMLLQAAGTVADLAAAGHRRTGEVLPLYLDNVRAALEQHLATEERVLLPILAADPPLGTQRVVRVLLEHDRQRRELTAAVELLATPGGIIAAATNLRRLVNELLTDMDDEERWLLSRDVLRDDLVSVDQDCG